MEILDVRFSYGQKKKMAIIRNVRNCVDMY